MSQAGKLIKGLVKAKKESVMGKLGDSPYEDPMEPWSAKYNAPVRNEEAENLQEDGWLFRYIKSLGYNPKVMPFAQRAKYARSNAFKHYKQSHMNDGVVQQEEVEQIDEISVDAQTRYFKAAERSKSAAKGSADYARKALLDPKKAAEHEKTVAKREKGISRYVKRYNERNPRPQVKPAAASAPYKPLGGRDEKSGRSYSESVEHLDEAGTGLLMSYIKSKGLDPNTMDTNKRHAYSRSSEFRIFKMRHVNNKLKETSGMGERGEDWNEEKKQVKEAVDAKDTVTMDIPLLIRVLEYAREDAKTDMDLHKVVENLIAMRGKGALSMDMYNKIVAIKEELEKLDELKSTTYTSYIDKVTDPKVASTRGKTQTGTLKSIKAIGGVAKAIGKRALAQKKELSELKKQDDNMEIADRITREEKKMKGADPCWKGYQMVGTKKKGGREVPNCVPEQVQEGIYGIEDSPLSATNSVKAMESSHRAKQMKSARMIKSLYKKKLKETLYDWEKDDKGGTTPNAKIVLKGGKTLTGKDRDVVEIEPILRTRPNSQNNK